VDDEAAAAGGVGEVDRRLRVVDVAGAAVARDRVAVGSAGANLDDVGVRCEPGLERGARLGPRAPVGLRGGRPGQHAEAERDEGQTRRVAEPVHGGGGWLEELRTGSNAAGTGKV